MEFKKEIEIKCNKNDLWNLIKDYKKDPEFWHGTRSIEKIDNFYYIQFAFPGKGKMSMDIDDNNYTIKENYLKGPFTGYVIKKIDGNVKLITEWNIKLSPLLKLFNKKLQNHFETGAENALKRIKDYFELSKSNLKS